MSKAHQKTGHKLGSKVQLLISPLYDSGITLQLGLKLCDYNKECTILLFTCLKDSCILGTCVIAKPVLYIKKQRTCQTQ